MRVGPGVGSGKGHNMEERDLVGGHLVTECLRVTALDGVPHASRLVLVAMAVHALDKARGDTPGRVYWGGHRMLALECFGDAEYGQNSPGRVAVKRAIRDLAKRGLIAVRAQPAGYPTAYEILPPTGVHHVPH